MRTIEQTIDLLEAASGTAWTPARKAAWLEQFRRQDPVRFEAAARAVVANFDGKVLTPAVVWRELRSEQSTGPPPASYLCEACLEAVPCGATGPLHHRCDAARVAAYREHRGLGHAVGLARVRGLRIESPPVQLTADEARSITDRIYDELGASHLDHVSPGGAR